MRKPAVARSHGCASDTPARPRRQWPSRNQLNLVPATQLRIAFQILSVIWSCSDVQANLGGGGIDSHHRAGLRAGRPARDRPSRCPYLEVCRNAQ